MDAANATAYWSRCRHHLQLQLLLPLSLIPFCSSHLQWICNNHVDFWIRDEGGQVFKTAGRGGSVSNAGCGAVYNGMHWVCLWGSSGCWCATTGCTRRGSWSMNWLLLCNGWGGSHELSDICHTRIVQPRWGGAVLTMDCRGNRTTSFRAIPLASRCGNASRTRGNLRIPLTPTLLPFLNISYDRSRVSVSAWGRHSLI